MISNREARVLDRILDDIHNLPEKTMYRVSWVNPDRESLVKRFDALEEAYAFFSYLVYQDGQAIGVGLYANDGATVVLWDARNGEMRSPSHPDAQKIRQLR